MRTADIGIWRDMQSLFTELVEQVLAPVGVEHELTYNRGVPPVLNDDVATALLASAAQSIDPDHISSLLADLDNIRAKREQQRAQQTQEDSSQRSRRRALDTFRERRGTHRTERRVADGMVRLAQSFWA